ncbi:MAG TPA: M48 family metalloprotease [Pyrinomonadaceae bacterium]|nr:M48 family metalloprotease [Pyrinomonadaceae bacterium]
MYVLLGLCLALAALLTLNALASGCAALVWRAVAPRVALRPASERAALLFALRVFPPALAALLAFILVLPAYVYHEPANSGEVVGTKLAVIAALSAAGVLLALWRVARTWLATRRLTRDWTRNAARVEVEGLRLPAYRLRHRFPVIAVIGVLRPRLFIAEQVFDALTEGELAAAVGHERGHVEARDNLKRALLRAGQDALLLAPLGRSLLRAWQRDSEVAADEFAASNGPRAAVDLASAIVKISKMIPAGARPTLPAGAHLLGADDEGLAQRVRNLLRLASAKENAPRVLSLPVRSPLPALLCLLLVATASLLLTRPAVLKTTHFAIERVVESLR